MIGFIMRVKERSFEGTAEKGEFVLKTAKGLLYRIPAALVVSFNSLSAAEHQNFEKLADGKGFITHPQFEGFECHKVGSGNLLQVMASPLQALEWTKSLDADVVVRYIEDVVVNLLK